MSTLRMCLVLLVCPVYFAATAALPAQDMPLSQVLIEGEGWEFLGGGYKFTEGPAADAHGNVYFTDVPSNRIHKINADGKISIFATDTAATDGLKVGPDGRIYGCRSGDRKIVAYDPDGSMQVIAEGVDSNDLVINSKGEIYFTDPPKGQVWFINARGEKRVVARDLQPNGIVLWPDEATIVITETSAPFLWTFRVETDGSLNFRERYYQPVRLRPDATTPGSDGMTMDKDGRLYLASYVGLQMFDPTGRPSGTILKPQEKFLSNVTFGGPKFAYLYVTCEDKVYRRKTKTAGAKFYLQKPTPK